VRSRTNFSNRPLASPAAPPQHLRRKSAMHGSAARAAVDPNARHHRAARVLATWKGHLVQSNHEMRPWWRQRGVPGAGLFVAILVAFEVVVLVEWVFAASHSATAAPATSHHMSAAGSK
jgi:hypothetical protein